MFAEAQAHLKRRLLPQIVDALGDRWSASIDENPEVIGIRYSAAFPSDYLHPEIQLEIGPLASWVPNAEYEITSFAAIAFPQLFARPYCAVRAIKAERTFWEKVTILHHEAHRQLASR